MAGSRFGTITSVLTQEPVASLTFDDGPHPHWTPRFLDVLDENGAKATFFVVGEHVITRPDVVRRIRDAGHAIGNHTHRHPSFPLVSSARRRRELRDCEHALTTNAEATTMLFRPPYLDQDMASHYDAWRLGYDVVGCSLHAKDWQARPAADMADDLTDRARAGDVILLHDAIYGKPRDPDRSSMVQALGTFFERTKVGPAVRDRADAVDVGRAGSPGVVQAAGPCRRQSHLKRLTDAPWRCPHASRWPA